MINISTPVSTFFDNNEYAELIMQHSDSLEGRPFNIDKNFKMNQETFHCDVVQPIHKMKQDEFDLIKKIVETKPGLNAISFHCAMSSTKYEIINGMAWSTGYNYSEEEMRDNVYENIIKIKNIVGDIELLIENNNYYPTDAYHRITDADFITTLVKDNDIGFLFDTAHAQVTAHNTCINYEDYKDALPFDRCRQIQVCKMGIVGELAKDLHKCPTATEFQDVKNIITKWPNIKYVTVEYYRDVNKLINALKQLRQVFND